MRTDYRAKQIMSQRYSEILKKTVTEPPSQNAQLYLIYRHMVNT